jgi:hypothetical protein
MGKTKAIAVNIAVIAIICVALIWGNTYWRQRTQFCKGEAALARGDFISAIAGYESAIHMYTPGSSLVGKSAERIWKIGEDFERAGDTERALLAYRSIRGSFYAVRGFSSPGKEWIARCDAKIQGILHQIRR